MSTPDNLSHPRTTRTRPNRSYFEVSTNLPPDEETMVFYYNAEIASLTELLVEK